MDPSTIVRCPTCQKANRVRPVAQGTPRCAACKAPLPWLVAADGATFRDEAQASVPVIVDLWAPWCGPCRMIAPALEQLALDRAGRLKVVKVDVDEAPDIAQAFAVQGIPLLVLLRDGAEVARLTGARPLEQIAGWLDRELAAA
ncbi:MAG TPA: thioredoxin [Baekduia sp.]|nr:thioredoxin [Baekduia sp.]